MDHSLLTNVCKQVYAKFPEVKGSSPTVQEHGSGALLIFRGKAKAADGKDIQRVVRVTVTPEGKISKMSTSR